MPGAVKITEFVSDPISDHSASAAADSASVRKYIFLKSNAMHTHGSLAATGECRLIVWSW